MQTVQRARLDPPTVVYNLLIKQDLDFTHTHQLKHTVQGKWSNEISKEALHKSTSNSRNWASSLSMTQIKKKRGK